MHVEGRQNLVLKILVVDNDTRMTEPLVRAALHSQECQLITATSLALAIFLARKNFPNVIVAGAKNAADDLELAREIKSDPELMHIPIVIVSPAHDAVIANAATSLGAEKYLFQPINEEQLFRELSPYFIELKDERPKETSE